MKEIDYIIEHGMKKYNSLYSSCMNRTIKKDINEHIHKDSQPKSVLVETPEVVYKDNNTIEVKKKTIVKETCYVYGGQGNAKLWSWDYGRVNDELDAIRDDLDTIDNNLDIVEIKNNQLNNEINNLKVLT